MDRRRIAAALVGSALLLGAVVPAPLMAAGPKQQRPTAPVPQRIKDLKLATPVTATNGVRPTVLAASLRNATGTQQVVIRLKSPADRPGQGLGEAEGPAQGRERPADGLHLAGQGRQHVVQGPRPDADGTQRRHGVGPGQGSREALARRRGPEHQPGGRLPARPVRDRALHRRRRRVQGLGIKGAGVTVAVLDSGIDYTHAALGGPGTLLAYENAFGKKLKDTKNTKINDAYKGAKLYPDEQGRRRLGLRRRGAGPTARLAPDPDPIPCGPTIKDVCDGTHGTHVADIIAGKLGVAPAAKLLAVKVCSSVSTSCSGVALIQGMDFAMDPNGDGSTSDAADIINMSLGSPYGPAPDDDLSAASDNASAAGTVVVASAGNSGDKPYIVGSPSSAKSAISVAQTAVPSSMGFAMGLSRNGGPFVPTRGGRAVVVQAARPRRREDQRPRPVRRRRRRQPRRVSAVRGRHARRQGRPRRPRHLQLQREDREHRGRQRRHRRHRPHHPG